MLLTIDVGNTNITLGVFENETLKGTFRMTTKRSRTSDEYGFNICGILEHRNIMPQDIKDVIIASVVPDIMHSLTSGIIKYLNIKPIIVSAGIKTGIRIVTENPKEIGPDRIVDAVAGYEQYGGPIIVVDFGTATTYDLIGEKGTFEAGITAPGAPSGAARRCFLRSRSESQSPFWRRRRFPVCRQDLCMVRSGRRNTLCRRSKKNVGMTTSKSWRQADSERSSQTRQTALTFMIRI